MVVIKVVNKVESSIFLRYIAKNLLTANVHR